MVESGGGELEMRGRSFRIWRIFPCRTKLRLRNGVCLLVSFLFLVLLIWSCWFSSGPSNDHAPILNLRLINWTTVDHTHKRTCRFHMCFNIHRCEFTVQDVLRVHVGGWSKFHNPQQQTTGVVSPDISIEYAQLIESVKGSRYYEPDPGVACVFIPSLDTLSQTSVEHKTMSTLLNSLPEWENGENYIIFNMLPGNPPHLNITPDYYYGKSMLASAGFTPSTYRSGFDVSIPVYNPMTKNDQLFKMAPNSDRPRLLTIVTHGDLVNIDLMEAAVSQKENVLLLKTRCPNIPLESLPWKRCGRSSIGSHTYPFPEVLLGSKFCLLVAGGDRTGTLDFTDMMMTGCIPVIIEDTILPFSEVLDWALSSIMCLSCDLDEVVEKLAHLPAAMVGDWRRQVLALYRRHFSSMAAIAMTTLNLLNERVFPMSVKSYEWWNYGYEVSHTARELDFIPPPKNEGFTAVILTYNRVSSLYKVITSVSRAPSCTKLIVIWNNVDVAPPPEHDWPKIRQPIEVIRSKENKLSNRFYPYDNLTTAVLSLDDDITMLTVDELEFAYKAWQEFPNRLVGFPSRVHIPTDNEAAGPQGDRWKYESNWLNNISLVLTGAAFYHKYYHYLYTYTMPEKIRNWIDTHMNCEDIAMNFLISNHTGLPPLKVTPRKKFKCPTCTSEDSLWTDPQHYQERNKCINIFEEFFGRMPLKAVKFRLDPILYKMDVEPGTLSYPDIGEL